MTEKYKYFIVWLKYTFFHFESFPISRHEMASWLAWTKARNQYTLLFSSKQLDRDINLSFKEGRPLHLSFPTVYLSQRGRGRAQFDLSECPPIERIRDEEALMQQYCLGSSIGERLWGTPLLFRDKNLALMDFSVFSPPARKSLSSIRTAEWPRFKAMLKYSTLRVAKSNQPL